MLDIHPTAIIGDNISFGKHVSVGPYAVIEDGVEIGNNTKIDSHAVVKSGTIIGNNCFVGNFAALGGLPQDSGFDKSIASGVIIGDNTTIHEYVTIHRATHVNGFTKVGSGCMLQSGSHIAHDCEVEDGVIIATGAMLGGKAKVGKMAFIGGGAAIHQRAVVGELVIISGNAKTALDLPPFTIAAGLSMVIGLNLVGLRRAKISNENIVALKTCFREFYKKTGPCRSRASELIQAGYGSTQENQTFLKFFLRESELGFAPKRRRIYSHNHE